MAYWGYYNNIYDGGGFNRDPWGTYTSYPGGADDMYVALSPWLPFHFL